MNTEEELNKAFEELDLGTFVKIKKGSLARVNVTYFVTNLCFLGSVVDFPSQTPSVDVDLSATFFLIRDF